MATATLRVLSSVELSQVHGAALRILDEVGMGSTTRARSTSSRAPARGSTARTNRAYLPPDLVEACRAQIPRRLTYHGRTPEFDRVSEVGGPIFGRNAGGCPDYVELESGAHRPARIADWREFVRLSDALPFIGAVGQPAHERRAPPDGRRPQLPGACSRTGASARSTGPTERRTIATRSR